MRNLAKENRAAFEEAQQKLAAGDADVNTVLQKWVEVLGVGGYWIIAEIEDHAILFAIAVSPWFGEDLIVEEEL